MASCFATRPLALAASLSALFLSATTAIADQAELVRDLNTAGRNLFVQNTWRLGNKVIASADDGELGEELWLLDPDPSKAQLIADIYAGPYPSGPNGAVEFKGKLYFTAVSPLKGRELWVTDGTSEGTKLVLDIAEGNDSSSPHYFMPSGSRLFFVASTPALGRELYVTDGTGQGTLLVKEINVGAGNSFGFAAPAPHASGDILFAGFTPGDGYDLWRSDGTPGGTRKIFNFTDSAGISWLQSFGDRIRLGRDKLWVTDGTTEGTREIPNSPECNRDPVVSNQKILCADKKTRRSIVVSDGTEMGTSTISLGADLQILNLFAAAQGDLVAIEAYNPVSRAYEIWRTDGTVGGTVPVTLPDFGGGLQTTTALGNATSGGAELFVPLPIRALNDRGDYKTVDSAVGRLSPGSDTVTSIFRLSMGPDFQILTRPFNDNKVVVQTASLLDPRPTMLLSRDGGVINYDVRFPNATASSDPAFLGRAGETILTVARGLLGKQLWRTDGTTKGTLPLVNLPLEAQSWSELGRIGALSLFSFSLDGTGYIVRSDGTPEGTFSLASFSLATHSLSERSQGSGTLLIALRSNGEEPSKLIRTDGTREHTGVVLASSKSLGHLVPFADGHFFTVHEAMEDGDGNFIFRARLYRLRDVDPNPTVALDTFGGSEIKSISEVGIVRGRLLLQINTGGENHLLISDEAAEQFQEFSTAGIRLLASLGDRALYEKGDVEGISLWGTDGTVEGAEEIFRSVNEDARLLKVSHALDGTALFIVEDETPARSKLFATGGTANSTVLLTSTEPGGSIDLARAPNVQTPHFIGRSRLPGGSTVAFVVDPTTRSFKTIVDTASGLPLNLNRLEGGVVDGVPLVSGANDIFTGIYKLDPASGAATPYVDARSVTFLGSIDRAPLFACQVQRRGVELCRITAAMDCTTDTDRDGVPDCNDRCPTSKIKSEPGFCGCEQKDLVDRNGNYYCKDECPQNPLKDAPGICGCEVQDIDANLNGVIDCTEKGFVDECPDNPTKNAPGSCGCGIEDTDFNLNGVADCLEEGFVAKTTPAKPRAKRTKRGVRITLQDFPGAKYLVKIQAKKSSSRGKRKFRVKMRTYKKPVFMLKSGRYQGKVRISYTLIADNGEESLESPVKSVKVR